MTIDPVDITIIDHVQQASSRLGVEWMLIGALARDIHLIEIAGIAPTRATNDVDIAVAVDSWKTFASLKQELINSGLFVASTTAQRVTGTAAIARRPLDIVPFGNAIEDATKLIKWPPDATMVMSVAGFEEAFNSSTRHRVGGHLIRLVSVPGLALLKLIAWKARHHETTKDALDFAQLLQAYEHVLGPDHLYEEHLDVLEANAFHPQRAGAWLLGAHMGAVASQRNFDELVGVLDDPRFQNDIVGSTERDLIHLETLIATCRAGLGTSGAMA